MLFLCIFQESNYEKMFQSKICCCLREKLVNFQLFWGRSGKVCRSIHFKSIHPAPPPKSSFCMEYSYSRMGSKDSLGVLKSNSFFFWGGTNISVDWRSVRTWGLLICASHQSMQKRLFDSLTAIAEQIQVV